MDWTLISNFAVALIGIVNPLGNLPIFISYTADDRKGVQQLLAIFVAATVLVFLLFFLFAGQAILGFFGISLAAFRIAGGILLLINGMGMIRGQDIKNMEAMVAKAGVDDLTIAETRYRKIIIPLGIPLFVGPGAISTVILYSHQAKNEVTLLGLVGAIVAVSLVVLICLLVSRWLKNIVGEVGLDIATRILGLLLMAIGVQFILGGLGEVTTGFILPQTKGHV
jgi:multiple antibiotic resistance protein